MKDPLRDEFERQYAANPLDWLNMSKEEYWRVFLAGVKAGEFDL